MYLPTLICVVIVALLVVTFAVDAVRARRVLRWTQLEVRALRQQIELTRITLDNTAASEQETSAKLKAALEVANSRKRLLVDYERELMAENGRLADSRLTTERAHAEVRTLRQQLATAQMRNVAKAGTR